LNFVNGWIDALRWQRLAGDGRLGEFLFKHIQGIAAYCDHPVRFVCGGVDQYHIKPSCVGAGMRDEVMLVLKLKWLTARPIRSARDVRRFLHPEAVHSLRCKTENTTLAGRVANLSKCGRFSQFSS